MCIGETYICVNKCLNTTTFFDFNNSLKISGNRENHKIIDYLPRKTTMTGLYYYKLICRVREALKAKRRGKIDSIPPKMQNVPFETLDSKK